jgi:hypothetical protein
VKFHQFQDEVKEEGEEGFLVEEEEMGTANLCGTKAAKTLFRMKAGV